MFQGPTFAENTERNAPTEKLKGSSDFRERQPDEPPFLDQEKEPSRHADPVEEFLFHRDPAKEIDVSLERKRIEPRLEAVRELIRQKKSEIPDEKTGRSTERKIEVLERAEKTLVGDHAKVEKAGEFNEVLEDLTLLAPEDFESILQQGRDKEGKRIKDRHGKELDEKTAQHLAGLASRGIRRLTWENLSEVYEITDVLIKELLSPLKRMVGLGE